MQNTMNDSGTSESFRAVAQKSEAMELGRDIESYIQRNFMVLSEDQFRAAYLAWLSCQTADRPDHRYDITQRLHRQSLAKVVELCGALS